MSQSLDRPETSATSNPNAKLRILIVDDESSMRRFVRRTLARDAADMIDADSGESAIVAVEHDSRPIDLLVADLRMPGMDGYQLANALQPRFPGMKVLFLTGFAEALFAHTNVLPAGWAFEEKPTTPRQLRDAVSLLLYGTLSGPGHPPGGDNPAGNLLSY